MNIQEHNDRVNGQAMGLGCLGYISAAAGVLGGVFIHEYFAALLIITLLCGLAPKGEKITHF